MTGPVVIPATKPLWSLAEIGALAGLFAFTLWVVGPHVAASPAALAFYWFAVAVWAAAILWFAPAAHGDPAALRGWGPGRAADDPGRARNAWRAYLGLTAAACALLAAITAAKDPSLLTQIDARRFGLKLAGYMVYGPIQALVFFGYLQTRLRRILACWLVEGPVLRTAVAFGVAFAFGAAHAPNWPLAGLVMGMGLAWSWLFYVRPNVLLAGFSHALLGTLVFAVLRLYTRIGPFYAHPEGNIVRHAIPGLAALLGDVY